MTCCCLVGTAPGEEVAHPDGDEPSVVAAPLRHYGVELSVTDVVAHGQVLQTFVNPTDHVLEVTYSFPVLPSLTVCGLRAELAGSVVEGRVLAKQAAREAYRVAVASEQTACLLEKPAGDVFRISLGKLPAHAEAKVTLDFVLELQTQGAGLRLGLPVVVGPRYPLEPLFQEACADEHASLAEAARGPGASAFSLAVEFEMPCAILGIASPTHAGVAVRTSACLNADAELSATATVGLELSTMPVREVVLEVALVTPLAPRCWVEPCAQRYDCAAALAVLHPAALDVQRLFPAPPSSEQKPPVEFIFLLDRSGSMQGDRIQRAAEALQLFLRSLPRACRFNILGFGSKYEVLFQGASVPYDADSLRTASLHAQRVQADLGGTELLDPLRYVLESDETPGYRRALVLLTDGQVSNVNSVFCLAQHHDARIYTLGIGSSVSHELVEGLAEASGGAAEFVVSSSERLEAKVVRQLERAIRGETPIRLMRAEWPGASVEALAPAALAGTDGTHGPHHSPLGQASLGTGGIAWRGERIAIAALLDFGALAATDVVRLHFAKGSGQTATMDVAVGQPQLRSRLHAAVGRALMEDLQRGLCSFGVGPAEKSAIEAQIVALGTKFQLVSKHTSMVAWDSWALVGEGHSDVVNISCNSAALHVGFPSGESKVQRASAEATSRWARSQASGEQTAAVIAEVEALHSAALAAAGYDLPATHPLRLQASLAYSGFLQDVGRVQEAATIARNAFEDGIAELDNVSEDSYKDSTLVMQRLRDSVISMLPEDDDVSAEQETIAHDDDVAQAVGAKSIPTTDVPFSGAQAARAIAVDIPTAGASPGQRRPSGKDDLQRLLPLQAFHGTWEGTDALAEILCIPATCFLPQHGASSTLWATALVLAFLQLRLAARSEEWHLIAGKARDSIDADGLNAMDLIELACSSLQLQWSTA
mmetsp:Transcript_98476/g.301267  ORF Transcript_98476/g.301267 Transcript_98476/m.301267 type:complete len:937 (-) Transcript_98476:260-3070(-)|eukprot:CAMPEP_0198499930 /NCGR_PEP_ID=MMETSP1462-20131121/7906_1 /TAXON_ID=1333877 /ORGANISM="Brandtodinium nutriculum, Strain RCC3387" /LENGTH=936 /DNA_ID=CAMNT_0044228933 /DNA_START=90 /DNA_END=2900 /DNA_ORIENTATION=+